MKRPLVLWLCCCSVLTLVGTKAYGLAESTGPGGSNAQAVHELGQKGASVRIGLISAWNVYDNHEAFFNEDANDAPVGPSHVNNVDFSGAGISRLDHDTWMAGIMGSRGGKYGSHPNDIGVAPEVNIVSARIGAYNQLPNTLDNLITVYNCRVIVSGIADPCVSANGQSQFTLVYDYYAETYDVVFANAAGNGGSVIWSPGDAYNGISTAGLIAGPSGEYDQAAIVSGSGYTADGRMKPDVAAPANDQNVPDRGSDTWDIPFWNDGQTSLAVPHTAGLGALLLGLADDTNETEDSHNEVIRAVIVNSAFPNIKDKQGQSTNPAAPNNVWHEDRGYGRVDALRAYELLAAGKVVKNTTVSQDKGWAYATMTSKTQVDRYHIQGQKNDRLVLTITWNRQVKKTGSVYSDESPPKFRLNLTIKDSNGLILRSESDSLNNLKKIEMMLPRDDTYEIVVTNPNTKNNRSYGLAFELIPPLVADFNLDYVVDINDLSVLAEDWLQSNTRADATGEGDVDFRDFAVFAANHGSFNPLYQ